jgi:hypothetical protein
MESPKGFSDRVENWLARIPGIRTYRDREHRRETDKRLREHLASQLQEARSSLKRIALDLSQKGQLDPLDELDRLSSHIQQMADTIRYASYGYGGIFDLEKIREEELDRLYAFDLSLMDDLEKIKAKAEELVPETLPETWRTRMGEARHLLEALEQKFRQRSDFLGRTDSNARSRNHRPRSPL